MTRGAADAALLGIVLLVMVVVPAVPAALELLPTCSRPDTMRLSGTGPLPLYCPPSSSCKQWYASAGGGLFKQDAGAHNGTHQTASFLPPFCPSTLSL